MDGGEDRTFKANFTSEGVTMLQDRVKEKLSELMGDYSDDTLAVSTLLSPSLPLPHRAAIPDPLLKPLASQISYVECGSVADGARLYGFCGITFRLGYWYCFPFRFVSCGHVMGFSVVHVLRRLEAHDLPPPPHVLDIGLCSGDWG
ncbi:RNA binding (RRM/RBD/RNP motifs) family protein [Zea mays]|jgi:hypothetical protein|uniref:RNA binding (RRM/RBD/RNP motifs) family protein n=1 Tax=Zea mays TaxID=4577 RepID=A0A1D6E8N5_MAIZE|nr:RNA binding (RRM/RBD/RNP motifs) family protein [Zea mays]